MRPESITMFERLFLASLAVSALGFILTYQEVTDVLAADPGAQQVGLSNGFVVGMAAAGYALYLLLWYLVARRASKAAKWVLVVFVALSVLFTLPALAGPWSMTTLFSVAVAALEVAALVFLFKPDAMAWLDGKGTLDPTTFD